MLITKTVLINWNSKIKKWYEEKGYIFTKMGDEFKVKVEDLTDGSHARINGKCDGCGKEYDIEWREYIRQYKKHGREGKYYCNVCAKNGYEKSNNFEEWCCERLTKKEADKLLERWCYKLNIDKNGEILSPNDISHGTDEKYWFGCLDNSKHLPELKDIHSYTGGNGDFSCNQCKSISVTHPHLIKWLVNEDDALKYSYGSKVKIPMKCIDCGYEKEMGLDVLSRAGFGCPKCSDGVSYPEKFFFNFLEQLKVNFTPQLSKKILKWVNTYRYDNYIEDINCIIETHGLFHYEENHAWNNTLDKTQENDFNKEWHARKNKVKNYIILDCRKSDMRWIKNSIMLSRLPKLLNFKEEDIDWLKCHEAGCKNIIKEACNLWNSGIESTLAISKQLKIHSSTVCKYLKKGAILNWCDYDVEKERRKGALAMQGFNWRSIICLNTMEIFESTANASIKYDILASNIHGCCKNKRRFAGRHPTTDERMIWMYYNKFLEKTNEEIEEIINNIKNHYKIKQVICLTTNEIFNSAVDAGIVYNLDKNYIGDCCRYKRNSVGKHPDTKERLKWMYYEDYIKLQNT